MKMIIDDQLTTLVYFHLEERASPHLHVIEEDDFARCVIVPEKGIKKSNFVEFINSRGLEKLAYIYQNLQADAFSRLLKEHDNTILVLTIQKQAKKNMIILSVS